MRKLGNKKPKGGSSKHLCDSAFEMRKVGNVNVINQSIEPAAAGWV